MNNVLTMAEYIACRSCDSPDCKGCNLKRLETMLENGKFECLMDENRGINTLADVAPVRHGRWETNSDRPDSLICSICKCGFDMWKHDPHNYCPNCGAKMDGGADNG